MTQTAGVGTPTPVTPQADPTEKGVFDKVWTTVPNDPQELIDRLADKGKLPQPINQPPDDGKFHTLPQPIDPKDIDLEDINPKNIDPKELKDIDPKIFKDLLNPPSLLPRGGGIKLLPGGGVQIGGVQIKLLPDGGVEIKLVDPPGGHAPAPTIKLLPGGGIQIGDTQIKFLLGGGVAIKPPVFPPQAHGNSRIKLLPDGGIEVEPPVSPPEADNPTIKLLPGGGVEIEPPVAAIPSDPILQPVLHSDPPPGAPSNPSEGDIWPDPSNNKMWWFHEGRWRPSETPRPV